MGRVVPIAALAAALWAPASDADAQCTVVGASCDDGQYCTVGETCDASLVCTGGSPRSCLDGNVCTSDSCNESADRCESTPTAAGTSCSDGEYCTDGDRCDGSGGCTPGGPRDCNDDRDCTADSCNESADRCDNDLTTGCLIRGGCVADGAAEPGDPCSHCIPSSATNRYTQAPTGAACGAASCSGGTLTLPPTCDATGACNPSADMPCSTGACLDGTTCAECTMDDQCATDEHCVDLRCRGALEPGEPCDRTRQCAAGFCVDGLCCTTACDGPCVACALTGTEGLCTAHPAGTDPDGDCAGATCTGLGFCEGTDGAVIGTDAAVPRDGAAATMDATTSPSLVAHGSGLLCSVSPTSRRAGLGLGLAALWIGAWLSLRRHPGRRAREERAPHR